MIENPMYCQILSLSPTMKNAKIGTNIFSMLNKDITMDVSVSRKAL